MCVLPNDCHMEGIEVTTAMQRAGPHRICHKAPCLCFGLRGCVCVHVCERVCNICITRRAFRGHSETK